MPCEFCITLISLGPQGLLGEVNRDHNQLVIGEIYYGKSNSKQTGT